MKVPTSDASAQAIAAEAQGRFTKWRTTRNQASPMLRPVQTRQRRLTPIGPSPRARAARTAGTNCDQGYMLGAGVVRVGSPR